jgi:hypothetical protein
MKTFLALAVLATSAASYSASRDLYDLMYLPNAGTTYGITELAYVKGEFEGKTAGFNFDGDVKGYNFSQTVGHAFTDRLSLQATLDYTKQDADTDVSGLGSQTGTTKGLSDPTISARFRVIDEDFRLDILGGGVISLGDQETDTETNGDSEINNRSGGHSLFVGAQLGQKTESFQWSFASILDYNLEGTVDVDGETEDFDSSKDLSFLADALFKVAESSFIRPFASVEFTEQVELDNGEEETAPSTVYELGGEFRHLISKDVMLKASLDYTSTNQASFDDFTYWTFMAGANYQF